MKRKKYMAAACILLVLAFGLYYFIKEEPYVPPKTNQEAKSDSTANITFVGNTIVERKNGKKVWEITAESSEVDPEAKTIKLNKFKGVLYQDNGGQVELVSVQALFDTDTRDIHLEGEVRAVSSDGATFKSAKARYAAKEQHIYGTGGITVTKGDTVITGDEIDSDAGIEKVKVSGNAHVIKGGVAQ